MGEMENEENVEKLGSGWVLGPLENYNRNEPTRIFFEKEDKPEKNMLPKMGGTRNEFKYISRKRQV